VYDLKISVIGAGAQGSAIALVLSKNPEVSEIVSADIDLKIAKLAVEKTKSERGLKFNLCVEATLKSKLTE